MKKPAEIAGAVGLTALALYFTALISSPRSGDKPSLGRLLEQILEARLEEGTKGSVAESTRRTYPGASWEAVSSPEQQGWSAERLGEARDYFDSMGADRFLVVHDGRILVDWGTERKFYVASIRKSLLNALFGIYVFEGLIQVNDTLGELGIDDAPPLSERDKQARVVDLLRSRSGIYHPAAAQSQPPIGDHPPGSVWAYNNWDFNALGAVFERQTGKKIFEAFEESVAKPLMMEHFTADDGVYFYERERSSLPAYHFEMTGKDLARFGLLYLRRGSWRDRQVVPEDWIVESLKPHSDAGEGGAYGYLWWIASKRKLVPGIALEDGSFSARGFGGQSIVVLPSLDLVIVYRENNSFSVPRFGS